MTIYCYTTYIMWLRFVIIFMAILFMTFMATRLLPLLRHLPTTDDTPGDIVVTDWVNDQREKLILSVDPAARRKILIDKIEESINKLTTSAKGGVAPTNATEKPIIKKPLTVTEQRAIAAQASQLLEQLKAENKNQGFMATIVEKIFDSPKPNPVCATSTNTK